MSWNVFFFCGCRAVLNITCQIVDSLKMCFKCVVSFLHFSFDALLFFFLWFSEDTETYVYLYDPFSSRFFPQWLSGTQLVIEYYLTFIKSWDLIFILICSEYILITIFLITFTFKFFLPDLNQYARLLAIMCPTVSVILQTQPEGIVLQWFFYEVPMPSH